MHTNHSTTKLVMAGLLVFAFAIPAQAQGVLVCDRDGDDCYYRYYRHPHFRWGISAAGGGFAGSIDGLYGGGQARFGVQFTDGFAVYYQGQGLIGSFIPTSNGASLVGISLNSVMFEARLGRHFELAGGPSLDFLWGCDGTPVNGTCGTSNTFFGLDGRIAGHFRPFTVSFDVHPMFFRSDAAAVLMILGLGVDYE